MTLPLLPAPHVPAGIAYLQSVLVEQKGISFGNYLKKKLGNKNMLANGQFTRTNNYSEYLHCYFERTIKTKGIKHVLFLSKLRVVNNNQSMDLRRLQSSLRNRISKTRCMLIHCCRICGGLCAFKYEREIVMLEVIYPEEMAQEDPILNDVVA